MPRQCQFPVQCSDNRRCYRSCSAGYTCVLALIAILLGYAGFSHAGGLADTDLVAKTAYPTHGGDESNAG